MFWKYKTLRDNIKKIPDIKTLTELIDNCTLAPIENRMLKMRYLEHKPLKECARELGYSQHYIYKMHMKALNKLKIPLQQLITELSL